MIDISLGDISFGDFSLETKEKKRVNFSLRKSIANLKESDIIPEDGHSIRSLSPAGGWSSCSYVLAIAANVHIKRMFASTLRVGKKEIDAIAQAMAFGTIDNAEFLLSGLSKENGEYDYQDHFEQVCEESGIKYTYLRNHAKVILLDTDDGKITIETSSNFNENPKIEQFCVTKSDDVYSFYYRMFAKLADHA